MQFFASPASHGSAGRRTATSWPTMLLCTLLSGTLAVPVHAQRSYARELAELSIEELMNESVTSVAKKPTTLQASPSAIAVVTASDISRWGFTSLPEALRLVPGMNVARISGSQWAISARGFNDQYAHKLLVLVDGRSVYTPSFGGVYWDVQDTLLEDLDRIEVIRGPGATLWGTNAVNGVVNITTKSAQETQGLLLSASTGTIEQAAVGLRYGGELAPNLHYRAYVKAFDRDRSLDAAGNDAVDAWRSIRGGFRADWRPSDATSFTLQGDAYRTNAHESVTEPTYAPPFSDTHESLNRQRGANLLAHWIQTFSDTSRLSLKAYVDHFTHQHALTQETRDTADFEFDHRFQAGSRHDIVWGAGYRFTTDEFNHSSIVTWHPNRRDQHLLTAFAQDEITLVPERVTATLGAKFEKQTFTGWEIQPSVRLLWTPTEKQTVWTSVSRAVNTASRFMRDAQLFLPPFEVPGAMIMQPMMVGNPAVDSEQMNAYELGYRIELARNFAVDLALFHNCYRGILGLHPLEPGFASDPTPRVTLPLIWGNHSDGETTGGEITARWNPAAWQFTASYSHLQTSVPGETTFERISPRHQASLAAAVDVGRQWSLSAAVYYVGRVQAIDITEVPANIPAYVRADVGLVWHPRPSFEIGFWARNILDRSHPEFTSYNTSLHTEVPRTFSLRATWRR